MALIRRTPSAQPDPEPVVVDPLVTSLGKAKKDRPTPTRKEAEALRRQRVTRTLTKKEARQEASKAARTNRMKTMNVREAVPEKALLRDYIDARFTLGEFLLPSLVVILALSFLATALPAITTIATVVMYLFILLVILDVLVMWRGFKKVLATRLPGTPTRGLLMYGMNRCIQIRRFRMPTPRIKRGEAY